jgi:putative adhesin
MKRTVSLIAVFAVAAALATFAQVFNADAISLHAPEAGSAHAAPAAEPQRQERQERQGSEFRWHEPLPAGRTIEIRGINGNVSAEPATSGEVEVVAVKRARRSDPDEVRIEVVRHAEGVLICAVYPNAGGEPNTCEVNSSRSHVRDNDTTVNFTIRVPAGVNFNGRTVNGEVAARNLGADVDAKTVNGDVNVSTAGLARAQTVNGSITAAMGRADWPSELEFKTVNGSIELSLPASLSARVEAKTLNGEITSDFQMTVSGTFSRRRLTGTIGGGGDRQLILETVNGSVQIRRAS